MVYICFSALVDRFSLDCSWTTQKKVIIGLIIAAVVILIIVAIVVAVVLTQPKGKYGANLRFYSIFIRSLK
jgi:hypothetical protein